MTAAGESTGSFNYERWSRDAAAQRRLKRAPAAVLHKLGSRADRRGSCHPSIQRLADDTRYSIPTVKRALADLERLKLIQSRQRGRRSAIRQLCPDAPLPAPPCPCGTMPLFDADLAPVVIATPAPVQPPASAPLVDPASTVSPAAFEVSPMSPRSTQGEGTEGGTRAARAAAIEQPVQEQPRALQEHLAQVLAIVNTAPGLLIEPLAVDSALAAYPEAAGHDHLRAAHTVASWAFEADGVRVGTANRLLMAALRKQTLPAHAGAAPAPRHDGRRRREPQVMCETVRRGDAVIAQMLADRGIRI